MSKKPYKVSGLLGNTEASEIIQTIEPPEHLQIKQEDQWHKNRGEEQEPQVITEVALDLIDRSPHQNRLPVPVERIEMLALDIKRHGLNNPVILRPMPLGRYELVVGETRVAAYRMNGEKVIPAFIRPMDDSQAAKRLVLDNFHHSDLSDYEI